MPVLHRISAALQPTRVAGALGVVACLCLSGCSSPDDPVADAGRDSATDAGVDQSTDVSKESCASADLEIIPGLFTEEKQPLRLVEPGDPVDLSRAVQGGHVIYIGAQVRGLTTDIVEIRARLKDVETGEIQAEEARTVIMKPVPDKEGWLEPDLRSLSQVAHIPACPNYDTKSIRDEEWSLEMVITEEDACKNSGKLVMKVVPTCMQTDLDELDRCECECEPGYSLGKCN